MRWTAVVWVASALLAAALPAQAQWKWRDADGQIHVSDRPPPNDIPEKNLLQRPKLPTARAATAGAAASAASAPGATASTAAPRVDPELEARRRKADQEQQAKAKADEERNAAIRADNCRRARQNLATLESGVRIARANEKGERVILDDAARAAELRETQQAIQSNCR